MKIGLRCLHSSHISSAIWFANFWFGVHHSWLRHVVVVHSNQLLVMIDTLLFIFLLFRFGFILFLFILTCYCYGLIDIQRWGWSEPTTTSAPVQDEVVQVVLGMNHKHILFSHLGIFQLPFFAPKFFSPPTYLTSFSIHSISRAPELE